MRTDSTRLAELRESIADRLRNICSSMPREEFDRLVEQIAAIEHKYEQRRDEELSE